MNTFIFIGLLVIVGGIILRLIDETPLLDEFFIFNGTILFFFGVFIVDTPTAIDVYRGKTTLEITYKDGIPVDSVMVFKDKKK
jgi:hypothetical protein